MIVAWLERIEGKSQRSKFVGRSMRLIHIKYLSILKSDSGRRNFVPKNARLIVTCGAMRPIGSELMQVFECSVTR